MMTNGELLENRETIKRGIAMGCLGEGERQGLLLRGGRMPSRPVKGCRG